MNPDKPSTVVMTVDVLRGHLDYDKETGVFRWKKPASKWSFVKAGSVAGYTDKTGYLYVKLAGKRYSQHRLAWLYVTGQWPEHNVDHIDGNPSNNAFSNLRDVPQALNCQNHKKPYRTSTTNALGVTRHKDKWRAAIRVLGKSKHLGLFASKAAASHAFLTAKRELHEGNTL